MKRRTLLALALVAGASLWMMNNQRNKATALGELGQDVVAHGGYVWDSSLQRPADAGVKSRPYQSLDELKGDRDMERRYKVMQLPEDMTGKTVLDLGCNLGRVCLDSSRRGAARVVGVDFSPQMIDVAKKYAQFRHESYNEPTDKVEFYVVDLNKGLENLKQVIGDQKFDYVFCLSIWGVVDNEPLWDIVNHYTAETCWFEGHKIGEKYGDQTRDHIEKQLTAHLDGEQIEFLGYSKDDKKRANFKVNWN